MKNRVVLREKVLLWTMLIMIVSLLGACQKEKINNDDLKCPVTAVEGPDDKIIGKWKLVKTRTSGFTQPSRIEDYSCGNIIYHFKQDGSLVVSGVQEGVLSRFENGEYSFVFSAAPISEGMEEKFKFTLEIGLGDIPCYINDNNMAINYLPRDGNGYYFVRVE